MRIAFVSSLVPETAPRSGFAIANRAVCDGLTALGHDVVAIGARQPKDSAPREGSVVLAELELENAAAGSARKIEWAARAFAGRLPFAAAKLRKIGADTVRAALTEAEPDAVVVNSYQMAAAFPFVTERPFVYLSHNVEARMAAGNVRTAGSVLERFMYRRDARLLDGLEGDLVRRATHVWCLSEEDASAFDRSGEEVTILPLLLPDIAPVAFPARAFDAVMIGTWTWEANAVGLRWFVDRILPLLPMDARIAVAGTVPAGLDLSDERLVVLGRVNDAAAFLAQGHVVPLVARGGSGVQLKSIEAFQRGRASVATRSSVRGIADIPTNCAVADEPDAFAAALIEAAQRGRAGERLDVDPAPWIERQRLALRAGLQAGLEGIG